MLFSKLTLLRLLISCLIIFSICQIHAEPISTKVQNPNLSANTCCQNLRGNINHDNNDIIDISDLVYFVNYSFGSPTGPEPPCFEEADIDGTGELDISDIVYLVGYMFQNRVKPYDCDDYHINLNLDTKVNISMEEIVTSGYSYLKFNFVTAQYYGCAGYSIIYSYQNSGSTFNINFTDVIPPSGICWTVMMPAGASLPLGTLPNGTYILRLNNGASVDLQLLVTDEFYQIIGDDVRQFTIRIPILYKAQ